MSQPQHCATPVQFMLRQKCTGSMDDSKLTCMTDHYSPNNKKKIYQVQKTQPKLPHCNPLSQSLKELLFPSHLKGL